MARARNVDSQSNFYQMLASLGSKTFILHNLYTAADDSNHKSV